MAYRGSNASGTVPIHIEDFLEAISPLSNEVKRNLLLIRTLDKNSKEETTELAELERKFINEAKRKIRERSENEDIDPLKSPEAITALAVMNGKREFCNQLSEEKIAIAEQTYAYIKTHVDRLTRDLSIMENHVKAAGQRAGVESMHVSSRNIQYDMSAAMKGDEVAIRPNVNDELWVLARVKEFDSRTSLYTVVDEDDNSKTYEIDEVNLVLLTGTATRLCKGEEVMAVYPDTTSFYRARVTQPPRRSSQIHTTTASVQFADDADESGITPHRLVPAKHIIKVPP